MLLCSARVRRHLRMLCEQRLPQMAVCSYNEIAPGIGVETTGVISAARRSRSRKESMEASTSNTPDDVKTFRGRSLEELLPQIRAELGPDAIVLRRREGRDKKAGGFFQRPFVEVDARAPHADERPLEIRSDRATAEGLSSPAVQALFEQATPFADALAAAARDTRMEDDTFSASFSPDTSGFSALPQEPEAETPRRMRDRERP